MRMKVLLLGPENSPLSPIIQGSGCGLLECAGNIDRSLLIAESIDFVVSYGYRHIVSRDIIDYMGESIINLHISLLPWNRGADPNLWSFLENTPKGVTIHHLDEGIDTGDIIAQKEVCFDLEVDTLASSYHKLNREIVALFRQHWSAIMHGEAQRRKQPAHGSFHRMKDKMKLEYVFSERRWDTSVRDLIGKADSHIG